MKIKKINSIFAALVLSTGILTYFTSGVLAEGKEDFNSLKSKYMVLMDYESGKIIYKKNADQKIYPASTTKIWTAYCVLQKCQDLNEKIKIGTMPEIEGSSMYLEEGEVFTTRQLLESLLIHSPNDVAYVLARHYGGGDERKFIDFMNSEAKKFGFNHTHFNNPHGLPDTDHYTTAEEMTNMARIAYGNDIIKSIVAKKSVTFKKSNEIKLDRELYNSNKFLNSNMQMNYNGKDIPMKYDVVDGIKTGYTDDAGNCLVATGTKNKIRMISGVFFAPSGSLYHDSRFLLDYGFENFKSITIYKKSDIRGQKKVRFAKPGTIKYSLANDYVVTTSQGKNISKDNFTVKYNFDSLKLPVKKGDLIGRMNIYEKGTMVSSIGLVSETDAVGYFDFILSKIPFLKDKSSLNSSAKVEKIKNDTKNSIDDAKKSANEKINSTKKEAQKKSSGIIKSVQDFFGGISDKFRSIGKFFSDMGKNIGMAFEDIKKVFSDLGKQGGIKGIQKLDFYKFLENEIKQKTDRVPPAIIIFGVPILIILVVLLLLINLIVDSIRSAFSKDESDDGQE